MQRELRFVTNEFCENWNIYCVVVRLTHLFAFMHYKLPLTILAGGYPKTSFKGATEMAKTAKTMLYGNFRKLSMVVHRIKEGEPTPFQALLQDSLTHCLTALLQ
jgi:hypothetical protein